MNINLQPNITGTNINLVKGATQADLTNAVNNSKLYRDESEAFSIVSENKSIIATNSANSASYSATTASNAANIATTKASEASNSANSASASETVCIAKATIATDNADIAIAQAVIATDKATEANTSANTANTQANIAIAKASEASISASNALTSENNADTSEANALIYKNQAESFANSINPSNLVHISGTETITGNKTFSGTVSGLTKSTVGLSNVDNTSDANKPISNEVQAALYLKADKATTLGGYGINDAYTKTSTDSLIDIHSKTEKTTLVDADEFMTADSTSTFSLKKITLASIKTLLANLFIPKVTSTDNAIVRFNGTTGDVQNSGIRIDDSGNILINKPLGGVTTVSMTNGAGNTNLVLPESGTVATTADINSISLSGVTAYHLLQGNLSVSNEIITNGFSTTLYTGNGGTQSINTGVDMATQWGNDVSETFGGLVWLKSRSNELANILTDTVRGIGKQLYTVNTLQEQLIANRLTSFNANGFSIGTEGGVNSNLATYASWNFQTTHRRTGVTNHGKAYTEHYNPFTGFTIIKYEGSGLAGHEIPHSLNRKLWFTAVKNLSATSDWIAFKDDNNFLQLNLTNAQTSTGVTSTVLSDTSFIPYNNDAIFNASTNQYIMYGWANSYYDESNKLIGNYEVGVYQGTGAAGNKVKTRGKPAWVMLKRLDSTGFWWIGDNQRGNGTLSLYANASNAEANDTNDCTFESNSFTLSGVGNDSNTSGGQYLYMVVYDNDSGSGKSKYPKATDTTNLSINALVPYANGIDVNGSKVSISYKNETITGLTLTQGKNYPYSKNDGTYGVSKYEPMYGKLRDRVIAGENPDYFDLGLQKWFSTTGNGEKVVNGDFNNGTTGWVGDTSVGTGTIFSNVNSTLQVTRASSGGWSLGEPYQILTLVKGKRYRLKALIGTNPCSVSVSTVVGIPNIAQYTVSPSGMLDVDFIAQDTTIYLKFLPDSYNATCNISSISIFELTPTISAEITPRTYLDCVVYADQNGQVTYVEELPKIEYKDVIKANEYQGKNALIAYALVDMTKTPPTIKSSFNVSGCIRISSGVGNLYLSTPTDTASVSAICGSSAGGTVTAVSNSMITFATGTTNYALTNIYVFGGQQ